MRVLLFDTSAYYPSSPLFLEALRTLAARDPGSVSHEFVDEAAFLRASQSFGGRVLARALRRPPLDCPRLNQTLLARARAFRPDVVLIVKGAYIAPATLDAIKRESGAILVNYATDDPFNSTVSTPELVESIPHYDIYACTKHAIMDDIRVAGGQRVIYVPFGYKPEVHFPEMPRDEGERERYASDVVFIGGCDQDRAPYFSALVRAMPAVKLALYGGYWNRWLAMRPYWRGFAVGREFRLAIGGARIAVNLVRKSNRDDHVMRTFEIPACGAFMLAERTDTHERLFVENDAVQLFSGPKEMIEAIAHRLAVCSEPRRAEESTRIAATVCGHSYSDRLLAILAATREVNSSTESNWPGTRGGVSSAS